MAAADHNRFSDLRVCRYRPGSGPTANQLQHVRSVLFQLAGTDAGDRDQRRVVGR